MFLQKTLKEKSINISWEKTGKVSQKIEKISKVTPQLYKDAFVYIHLIDRHFIPILTKSKIPKAKGQIGSSDNYSLADKINFSQTMLEVSKLELIVVEQWKHEKNRLSAIYDLRLIK